ncbi:MAG: hypothetical protein EP343_17000 [Deltaproteobacteria bacterium]|nr:MAG: hypothetical protein EP343_17000 [Deltaproteobacteria bacterium]
MRIQRHMSFLARTLLLCSTVFLLAGCGNPTPQEGIVLKIDQKTLNQAESFKMWVIGEKLKNGNAVTCLSLLENTTKDGASFDATQFVSEQRQDVTIDNEKGTATFKELSLGKKLFVVAGFGKDNTDDKNPVAIGCTAATIEAGKKVFVSIFLAQITK